MKSLYEQLWDDEFGDSRTDSDWLLLFDHVLRSFTAFIEHPVTSEVPVVDDRPNAAHCCVGAGVTIPIIESIGLCYAGGIDISVNRGQSVSIRAMLLLFCNGKRLAVHPKREPGIQDWYWFELDHKDVNIARWIVRECFDESGEWEGIMSYSDLRPLT